MVHAVVNRYFFDFKGIDPLQTADVEAVLVRVGPPLMMRVDATCRAEEMLRCIRVELIEAKRIIATRDPEAANRSGRDDCATSPAHRTIAMSRINQPVR